MSKNILAYLFGDSQLESELDETRDYIEQIMEAAESAEPIKAKRTPLAAALKMLGVDATDGLELDPEGFSLAFDGDKEYHAASSRLREPDAMEKLAEMGWVVARLGDRGMANEPADYRIRFIEIATAASTDSDKPSDTLDKIMQKGREFTATEMDRDDETNPVDHPEAPNKKHAGMTAAKDGEKTDHAIHGGKSKSESTEIADGLLNNVNEGGHKAGCECGFCKNKGRFKKKGEGSKEKEEKPDAEATSHGEQESLEEPARYDDVAEGKMKDWLRQKKELAKEIVRPGQSGSYRKFRTKEFLGIDPDKKEKPSGALKGNPYARASRKAAKKPKA